MKKAKDDMSMIITSIKRFYRSFDPNFIYLFKASDLSEVLELRKPHVAKGELPGPISLQEMICCWSSVAKVRSVGLADCSRARFSFISHMHSTDPDKLGSDVITSIAEMGQRFVWMDLCSMCQDNFPGDDIYNYDIHTRPVVLNLHTIMQQAYEGCICLNVCTSQNPDPLDIYSLFRDEIGHRMNKMLKLIASPPSYLTPAVPYESSDPLDIDDVWESAMLCHGIDFANLESFSNSRGMNREIHVAIQIYEDVKNGWFPTNEYFGRLWCYVERLGMSDEAIYVYPSRKQIVPEAHIHKLWKIYNILNNIFESRPTFISSVNMLKLKYMLGETQNMLVDYTHRYRQIFGMKYKPCGDFSFLPTTLGPFAQVELLSCYCDSDRIVVAKIEAKLRGEDIIAADWVGGLQICLGVSILDNTGSLETSIAPRPRCPVGKVRHISAEDYCDRMHISYFNDTSVIATWICQLSFLASGVLKDDSTVSVRTGSVLHSYEYDKNIGSWRVGLSVVDKREPNRSRHYAGYHCACHLYQAMPKMKSFIESAKGKPLR